MIDFPASSVSVGSGEWMRELWLQTWELFRRRPVLWIPVLCADLVAHTLRFVWPFLINSIAATALQRHTVFGGAVARDAPVWFSTSLGLVRFLCEWIGTCTYIAAAIVTAKMVQSICHRDRPTDGAKVPVTAYAGNVGWVALQTLLLSAAVGLVVFVPTLYLAQRQPRSIMNYVTWIETLFLYLTVAYLMTPPALRLIGRTMGHRPVSEAVATGRNIALALATCSWLLGFLDMLVKIPGVHERGEGLALGYLKSLFVALPYVPLFIAFGLLAMKTDGPSVGEPGAEAPILEREDSGA